MKPMAPPPRPRSAGVGFAWSRIVSSHIHGPKIKAGSAFRKIAIGKPVQVTFDPRQRWPDFLFANGRSRSNFAP